MPADTASRGYTPALLVGRRRVALSDEGLTLEGPDGAPLWRARWDEVARAALVEHRIRGTRMRRLDLVLSDGTRRSLSHTGGGAGPPAADPEGRAHLAVLADVLARLARHRPDLAVTLGEYGRAQLAIFAIGAVSVLGAVALLAAALASGLSGDRLAAAALPIGVMLLFGAALVLGNRPWRPRPAVPAARLSAALAEIADPDPNDAARATSL